MSPDEKPVSYTAPDGRDRPDAQQAIRGFVKGQQDARREVASLVRTEMGPAFLPTPLSPAVGPEGRLSPGVSRASGEAAALCRPALAPVPVPSAAGFEPRIHPLPPAVPRPFVVTVFASGPPIRRSPFHRNRSGSSGLPTARLRGLDAPGFDRSEDLPFPFAPPRGISPSYRQWFQNLFVFQGVIPSIRRANPRSR